MSLPEKHDIRIILTGTKLRLHFNIKDDTNKQRKLDLVYFSRCPSMDCADSYIGETARSASNDTKLHIVKLGLNSNHKTVNIGNFKILNMGYSYNIYKRGMSEALFVKQYHPSLNMQDNSVPLQLFN